MQIGAQLASAAGAAWHAVPPDVSDRVAATAAAVAAEAPLIWGAVLPRSVLDVPSVRSGVVLGGPEGGRRGGAELLVRLPGGGYVPLIVVRHRITDPGSGALTAPLPETDPRQAVPDPARKPRTQARDLLRLAHLHRMLEAAGWAPGPGEPFRDHGGGDRARRRRRGLARPGCRALAGRAQHARGVRRPVRRPDRRRHGRRHGCACARPAVADHGVPPLPVVAHLRGRAGARAGRQPGRARRRRHRAAGSGGHQRGAARGAGPRRGAARPPRRRTVPGPGRAGARLAAGPGRGPAGAGGAASCGRTSRWTSTWRASASPGPTCGACCSPGRAARCPATSRRATGPSRPGSRCRPRTRPARSPRSGPGSSASATRAAATGRSFAAYCYNEQAENRWLLASARRFAGLPGIPDVAEVEAFIADDRWVDLFAVVGEWFLCAHGKGLKRIAPAAGFAWRDPEASGENSMRWYRDAVGMDGVEPDLTPAPAAAGVQRGRRRRHPRAARVDDHPRGDGGAAGRRPVAAPHVTGDPALHCGRSPRFGVSTPLRRGCSVRGRDPKLFPGSRVTPAGTAGEVAAWVAVRSAVLPRRWRRHRCRGGGCWLGAAGLAAVPVLAGIAPAAAQPVVPAPVPRPAPTPTPGAAAALAKLQKGRAPRVRTASATRAARTSPCGSGATARPASERCSSGCRRSTRRTPCSPRWP